MTRRAFLAEYIKNIREVGAVAPSSRYLARKMCEPIDFTTAKVIVEYGPGTGVFTQELVDRMMPGTKLLLIESNVVFYHKLSAQFSKSSSVIVEQASAEAVTRLLKKHSLAAPDAVVSGLPFAALPGDVSKSILKTTKRLLGAKGMFITFQYTLLKKGLIENYFDTVTLTRELRNIPPAYVLSCKNNHEANSTRLP